MIDVSDGTGDDYQCDRHLLRRLPTAKVGFSWTEHLKGHRIVRNLCCDFKPAFGSQAQRLACTAAASGPSSLRFIQKSPDIRAFGALASKCILGDGRKVRVGGSRDFDFHARDHIRLIMSSSVERHHSTSYSSLQTRST
jgi:hypothetical protein